MNIRVLVVDDSAVIRKLVSTVLAGDPEIEVVGHASNGDLALRKIPTYKPDLITLDVEMPVMDGIETLRKVRELWPDLPVIMFSVRTQRGAMSTLEALTAGASDYVTKPAQTGSVAESIRQLQEQMIPRIKAQFSPDSSLNRRKLKKQTAEKTTTTTTTAPPETSDRVRARMPIKAVCIGISTGGPQALEQLIPAWPSDMDVPVFIVQHMPKVFTSVMAQRLNENSAITVQEVKGEMDAKPGNVYIAPGGKHMVVHRFGVHLKVGLDDGPPENSCRPSADVLFRSAAKSAGSGVLGVVMTGMGNDALGGCRYVKDAGGLVYVQDESSCVVYGMPKMVVDAGLADGVYPLPQLAPRILECIRESRKPSTEFRANRD